MGKTFVPRLVVVKHISLEKVHPFTTAAAG